MKKLLTLILAISMIASLAACGNKETTNEKKENDTKIENKVEKEEQKKEEKKEDKKDTAVSKNENKTDKKEENKASEETKKPQNSTTVQKPEVEPELKPETTNPVTPEVKPEEKPATKPEEKPQENTKATVANTLLAAFKSKVNANSGIDVVTLANELVTNPVIKFGGGAMEVEQGYLTGFDNTEIKGFKKGAMFAPMIGTIPFVGYVFELEDGTDASSFISTLKSSANLRWNICTTADEMVAGSAGNKVFFVMSSFSFDEE